MAGFLFVTFMAAMAGAALVIKLIFDAFGLIPDHHNAKVVEASITRNYTTFLNLVFPDIGGSARMALPPHPAGCPC